MSDYQGGVQQGAAINPDDIALGENASAGYILLPAGYYPVKITRDSYESSRDKGTPGLRLMLTVLEGPHAGVEIGKRAGSLWLTPGGPQARGEGRNLGKINHMVHQVTGKYPDRQSLIKYGVPLSDPGEVLTVYRDIWQFFNSLDPQTKLDFMAQYARVNEWDGKKAIVYLSCDEEERVRDGEQVMDERGQPVTDWVNSIANFYGWDDAKHGYASWKNTQLPLQEKAAAQG